MKEKLKLKTNLPILILVSVITCYLVVKDSVRDVRGIIASCNILFIVLAFITALVSDLFKGLSLFTVAKKCEADLSLKDAYSLQLETNFFNGVTPFALGGQPFQLYLLKHRNKLPYVKGSYIIFCDYYAFQIVLLFFTVLFFFINLVFHVIELNSILNTFLLLGFLVHVGTFSVLIYASKSKTNSLALKFIHLLKKMHIIKKEKKIKKKVDKRLNKLRVLINEFQKDKKLVIKTVVYNGLKLIFYSLAIVFIFKSIDVVVNPGVAIIAGVFTWVMASFVPIPGATGGVEFSFITMFETLFAESLVASAVILWRFTSYYLMVIFGAILFVIMNKKFKKPDPEEED